MTSATTCLPFPTTVSLIFPIVINRSETEPFHREEAPKDASLNEAGGTKSRQVAGDEISAYPSQVYYPDRQSDENREADGDDSQKEFAHYLSALAGISLMTLCSGM
jgi:hypothetical protein